MVFDIRSWREHRSILSGDGSVQLRFLGLKLSSEGSLESFVNEMKALLLENNNRFNLTTSMQILVTSKNNHASEVRQILEEIATELVIESTPSDRTTNTCS